MICINCIRYVITFRYDREVLKGRCVGLTVIVSSTGLTPPPPPPQKGFPYDLVI